MEINYEQQVTEFQMCVTKLSSEISSIGEKEDGFLYSIAICGIWSRNRRSVIHDRFCHLGLVGFGIGYFRR